MMSHFIVLVCLPAASRLHQVNTLLAEVLEPWNENRAVDPYRSYEHGEPGQFWAVPTLRRNGWALPEPGLSWVQVAAAYNSEYGHADDHQLLVDEHDRAYTISTYNPESRWDWWTIGGRWPHHLIAVAGAGADQLIGAAPGAVDDNGHPHPSSPRLHCAGGPRRLLDFTMMRDAAQAAAQARYDRWEAICATTPPARSWSQVSDLASSGELTIEQARERYQTHAHHRRAPGRAGRLAGLPRRRVRRRPQRLPRPGTGRSGTRIRPGDPRPAVDRARPDGLVGHLYRRSR